MRNVVDVDVVDVYLTVGQDVVFDGVVVVRHGMTVGQAAGLAVGLADVVEVAVRFLIGE